MSEPYLVIGLGNPGPAYAGTRHNIGAMVVAALAEEHRTKLGRHKRALAEVAEFRIGLPGQQDSMIAACPMSYMNESGGPVKALMQFYSVHADHLIVVHDELDLPFASLRVKFGGGDNGHNGLKSIRSAIGTGEYLRIRMGIGRPQGRQSPADYVLQSFSAAERKELPAECDRGAQAITQLVEDGLAATQNAFND